MKKLVILAVLAMLGIPRLVAQDNYEYVPFVREGVKWVCFYENYFHYPYSDVYYQPGRTYFTLEVKGDTTIGDHTYKAMHKYSGQGVDETNDTVLVYLREEDKVVYGLVPDTKQYPEFYVGYGPTSGFYFYVHSGEEFTMYDFNDPNGFCSSRCNIYPNRPKIVYMGEDMVAVGDRQSRRHTFRSNAYDPDTYIIEGIGADGYRPGYPLSYLRLDQGPTFYLSHVIEDGKVVYEGLNHEYLAPLDGRLPVVREGVQWVNEHVIINQGDTTRYYYTYEIKGNQVYQSSKGYNTLYKQCHYYTGPFLDEKNDSVICLIEEGIGTYIRCLDNFALDRIDQEGRYLLDREWYQDSDYVEILYKFSHDNHTVPHFYLHQRPPKLLTRDNFFQTEDVEVEGHSCTRYVYVDEQGEPVAYMIEGIGFDSRDMGDLLTPFTRQPDPDADYQEYCGLSHVIKDGEIIYKGMRYDAERVEAMAMDINGDGLIDVADVTTLIAKVLQDGNTPSINGSGNADVSDVVRLIDYVLHH